MADGALTDDGRAIWWLCIQSSVYFLQYNAQLTIPIQRVKCRHYLCVCKVEVKYAMRITAAAVIVVTRHIRKLCLCSRLLTCEYMCVHVCVCMYVCAYVCVHHVHRTIFLHVYNIWTASTFLQQCLNDENIKSKNVYQKKTVTRPDIVNLYNMHTKNKTREKLYIQPTTLSGMY